jgi:hypothetical protein
MAMEPQNGPPPSIRFERTPEAAEITLLERPRFRRSGRLVLGAVITSLVAIGITTLLPVGFWMLDEPDLANLTLFFPIFAVITGIAIVASEFNWEREGARLVIREDTLALKRKGGIQDRQWDLSSIRRVDVRPLNDSDDRWELRLLLKNGIAYGMLDRRSKRELDWLAGLLRAAIARPPQPRPVVQEAIVSTSTGGECQVCSSTMETRIVYCARCRTPHHEECWVYAGMCSTYGCREIGFVRSRT